jgi:hypothetical protein
LRTTLKGETYENISKEIDEIIQWDGSIDPKEID